MRKMISNTVGALLDILGTMEMNDIVLLSIDEEGNGYGELSSYEIDVVDAIEDGKEVEVTALIIYPSHNMV